MQTDDLCFAGVSAQAAAFRSGAVSPVELTRAHLDRIRRLDPDLKAFITVDRGGGTERRPAGRGGAPRRPRPLARCRV